jgi:hypothetical protein
LILIVFAFGWFYQRVAAEKTKALQELQAKVDPLKRDEQALGRVMRDLTTAEADVDQYGTWMEQRFYWATVLSQLREALMAVEDKTEKEFNAKTGVWIEKLTPMSSTTNSSLLAGVAASAQGAVRGATRPQEEARPDVRGPFTNAPQADACCSRAALST